MCATTALNPSSDASSLRRVFARQPGCLIRVRLDGVLLGCNRAAVGLFGAAARPAILGTNLIDRITPAQRVQWQEFMRQCWETGAASFEGDLVVANNEARSVLVQGIALKDHPDGFESLLLHVGLPADEDRAERHRLIETLDAQSADRNRSEAKFVELQRKLEESQLAALQKEREHRRDIAMLKAALAAAHAAKTSALAEKQELEALKLRLQTATAEQERLQALVADCEEDRTRIAADHQATVDTLAQSLTQAVAEQSRMAARAEEQTREQDLMRAAHQQALLDLQASKDASLADAQSHLARTLA